MIKDLISIIIPTYNSSRYLKQCLEGCLNQTYKNIEIICVDNGSIDSSVKIIKDFMQEDVRIKLIEQKSQNAGMARNKGVELAKGEYLIFLDSDDWLELNAIEKLFNKISQYNSDIVIFDAYKYFEKENKKETILYTKIYFDKFKDTPFSAQEAKDILFNINGLAFKMYRKKVWDENNVKFSNHKYSEDSLPLFSFLINSNKISVLNLPIYNYRIHNQGLTSKMNNNFKDIFEVFYECEKVVLRHENCEKYLVSFLKNRLNQIFYWFFNINLSKKRKYYIEMKKLFNYIRKKYSKEILIETGYYSQIQSILEESFFKNFLIKKIKMTFYLLFNQL